MLPRQRVLAALRRQAPDRPPVRVHPSPGGLYEHGQKLLDLMRACGSDFGDMNRLSLPTPPDETKFDSQGRYHSLRTDAWGTTWEHRIFGVIGHPVAWPLNDWGALDSYAAPSPPPMDGPAFHAAMSAARRHKRDYYLLEEGGPLFEKMHALRRFEDVLMDMAVDTPEIHRVADMICDHMAARIQRALGLGADGIAFGDDFGTQEAMILSPDLWRRFFKPRYEALFEPIVEHGKDVFFHSCGAIDAILDDVKEIGVTAVWPQLTSFDLNDLARRCRDLQFTIELHPDRGELMQRRSPDDVRRYVEGLYETFDMASGGAWFYVEIDPGFHWANVEALFETVMRLRC